MHLKCINGFLMHFLLIQKVVLTISHEVKIELELVL